MVERQDIDALLIGSLYGELSSADEARLAAHLESHPADRTALADLTRAREAVRESRILQVQFDPPQSISALLMQEAVRRAPKAKPEDGQSWFQRIVRGFMMHPAMAAAAMLVVVVGVAGTMYMRKGDHFAKQTAEQPARLTEKSTAPVTSPADDGGEIAAGADPATAEFKVGLRDELESRKDKDFRDAEDQVIEGAKQQPDVDANRQRTQLAFEQDKKETGAVKNDLAKAKPDPAPNKPAPNKPGRVAPKVAKKPPAKKDYLEVTTPDQVPKDFEAAESTGRVTVARGDSAEARGVTGGKAAAAAPGSVDRKPAEPKPAPAPPPPAPPAEKPNTELAWAQAQHQKIIQQVKAGRCNEAAALAVQISNRNPTYYAANVESDRTIKPCVQYITAQREKEAERVQRAKATQKRSGDEPAKAAPTSTK